jgi:hypothetical protein
MSPVPRKYESGIPCLWQASRLCGLHLRQVRKAHLRYGSERAKQSLSRQRSKRMTRRGICCAASLSRSRAVISVLGRRSTAAAARPIPPDTDGHLFRSLQACRSVSPICGPAGGLPSYLIDGIIDFARDSHDDASVRTVPDFNAGTSEGGCRQKLRLLTIGPMLGASCFSPR